MTALSEVRAQNNRARIANAALYYGVEDVRIETIEIAQPGADEVTIEVAYAGICGSDLHEYFSGQTVTPTSPHPLTGQGLPIVLGHEFSGTVVEVGTNVPTTRVGDRVVVRPTYSCGRCASCDRGHPNTCSELAFHGLNASGGGLSTYTNVPSSMVFTLPESVSLMQGALVEPMAVSSHGVQLGLQGGQVNTAFVGGAGMIGIGAVAALRAQGINEIIVADLSETRRAIATQIGATVVFDPREVDLVDVLDGRVLDLAIEAAGSAQVINTAIAALGPRGRLILIGLHEAPTTFDPTTMLYREVSMQGSSTYTNADYTSVIAAMESDSFGLDPASWVQTRSLEQLIPAFEALRSGESIKILIDMHEK